VEENILIIGSGMSFHNLKVFLSNSKISNLEQKNINDFDQWLVKTCTDHNLTSKEREQELSNWHNAPSARFCHPREEHLIPLHVCAGIKSNSAELVFNDEIMDAKCSAFLW
jgi:aromatic ring-opening dioxygenase catalytic subunit (LigB family)